jgi:hypothetical protein
MATGSGHTPDVGSVGVVDDDDVDQRLNSLVGEMAEMKATVARLVVFATACWAGAALLADERPVQVE